MKKLGLVLFFSLLVFMFFPILSFASNEEIDLNDEFSGNYEDYYHEDYENSNKLLDPNTDSDEIGINGGGLCERTYPGTSTCVLPGDVLYTKKSTSTYFVGHVGIVNTNMNVAHILTDGFRSGDSLSTWRTRFSPGQTTVYRYNDAVRAYNAATKISDIRNNFVRYDIGTSRYDEKYNYCSKMIWQAYYRAGTTLGGWTIGYHEFITPSNLVNQAGFKSVANF